MTGKREEGWQRRETRVWMRRHCIWRQNRVAQDPRHVRSEALLLIPILGWRFWEHRQTRRAVNCGEVHERGVMNRGYARYHAETWASSQHPGTKRGGGRNKKQRRASERASGQFSSAECGDGRGSRSWRAHQRCDAIVPSAVHVPAWRPTIPLLVRARAEALKQRPCRLETRVPSSEQPSC